MVEGSLRSESWMTVTGEKKEQEVANGPKRLNVLSQDFVAEFEMTGLEDMGTD